ncbi:hypothetical protein M758_UG153700 [Ceratodon purpureus]|nr:hypothetical protein M758_UG153700 [Ceratodon purpureus]
MIGTSIGKRRTFPTAVQWSSIFTMSYGRGQRMQWNALCMGNCMNWKPWKHALLVREDIREQRAVQVTRLSSIVFDNRREICIGDIVLYMAGTSSEVIIQCLKLVHYNPLVHPQWAILARELAYVIGVLLQTFTRSLHSGMNFSQTIVD